jgi:hypothetical protein
LRETAHKLYGLVATFSSTAGAAARALKQMGASGQSDGAKETYTGLADMVEKLYPVLDHLSIDQLQRPEESDPGTRKVP